jgi:uncharacterized protein (DUF885 family)
MTTITEVVDGYLSRLTALDPDALLALGGTPELLYPDLSPDGFAGRAALARECGAAAATATAHAPGEAGLKAAFVERMDADVELHDAGFLPRLLAPLATPVHAVRMVFDILPRESAEDWAAVLRHLQAVPGALRDYRATLTENAQHGNVVARRQVLTVADQCAGWTGESDFYAGVAAAYPDGPLAAELTAAAAGASAATRDFEAFLRTELAPLASTVDGVGREMYAVTARAFLGVDLDLDELYEYGWAELARTAAEMTQVAQELGHPDPATAMAALDADPQWRVAVGEPLEEWLRARVEALTDALDGAHFDIPAATRHADCHISRTGAGVLYYVPPDPALTRSGSIWWSVPPGSDTVPVWQDSGSLCHEGLPGHHLQHAITLTTAELHPWQRVMCHIHGYAEGWAHYAERLADELGLYRHPAERLGMLAGQMWRAARIVIDMGLHLDAPIPAGNGFTDETRWEPVMAAEFLARVAGLDPHTARFEVDRYLGWPAQALAFKAGARLWWQVREDAERAAGDSFDRKAFHMAALRLGPMGLGPLRAQLAQPHAPRHLAADR